jgi:hypothetical protein
LVGRLTLDLRLQTFILLMFLNFYITRVNQSYLEIGRSREVKDHRSCCTGTHDLLPSPLSGEAWALMQSSLTVFWVWDTSQVSGWENDRVQPTHPAPTLEKRRPSDKWHQQWLGLQASGLWWRGPVPSQSLRPVSTPDPATLGCKSET